MKKPELAHLVAVHMGLGHLRAAYPLRSISAEGIIVWGSRGHVSRGEKKYWRLWRRIYYHLSRVGSYPVIGKLALKILISVERIPSFYPKRDLSRPTAGVRLLKFLIRKANLGRRLPEYFERDNLPVLNTFYATAIALDMSLKGQEFPRENYVIICDADVNRIWVPEKPAESQLKYLVPCSRAKSRLINYGVKEEKIFVTGFPLPTENIGSEGRMEGLKIDLMTRLGQLDPSGKFFAYYGQTVHQLLGLNRIPGSASRPFTIMFAIGGAGAQVEIVGKILKSLNKEINSAQIRLIFACGVQRKVLEKILKFINQEGLSPQIGRNIYLIYQDDVFNYFDQFNRWLRQTDILWTKPGELSFYCGLGIPILMAAPIGPQEERNRRWLMDIHAGLVPPGPPEYCAEWLSDLRKNGRLAEAAWAGFIKARKLGTYKIAKLLETGQFTEE